MSELDVLSWREFAVMVAGLSRNSRFREAIADQANAPIENPDRAEREALRFLESD